MSESEIAGLIIGIFGLLVGLVGTGVALYQRGVMNEAKKRRHELQFLLAGVGNTALLKSQAWDTQFGSFSSAGNDANVSVLRHMARARDDFKELHGLVTGLEGAIDAEASATTAIMKKILEQGQINREIQQVSRETSEIKRS